MNLELLISNIEIFFSKYLSKAFLAENVNFFFLLETYISEYSRLEFTCSKLTIEILKKGVKYIQS